MQPELQNHLHSKVSLGTDSVLLVCLSIAPVHGSSVDIDIVPTAVPSLADTWPFKMNLAFNAQPAKSIVTDTVAALEGIISPAITGKVDSRKGVHTAPDA